MPTLTPQGYITGTLDGQIGTAKTGVQAPLAGVAVTATPPPTSNCITPPPVSTDSNGNFTIVGDPTTGNGGLCANVTYQLTVTVPTGYSAPTNITSVTISTTSANNAGTLIAQATQLTQVFAVSDQSGHVITGVVITGTSTTGGRPTVGTGGPALWNAVVDPTTYTFNFAPRRATHRSA